MARRRRPRHGPPDLVCRRTDMQFSGMWQKVAMDADAAKKMNGAGDVLWVVMMAGDWSAVFPLFFLFCLLFAFHILSLYLSVRAQM